MSDGYFLWALIIMAGITIVLRALPFLVFKDKSPRIVSYLGEVLPMAIMAMLVVYCLKDISFETASNYLPQLIAGALTVVSYVIKRNTLISIIVGTLAYMLLIQFVF